jgi:hypothetical protein
MHGWVFPGRDYTRKSWSGHFFAKKVSRPLFRTYNAAFPCAHLLSAGEAFEDLVFVGLERLPAAGEEVRTNRFTTSIGGGAPITSRRGRAPRPSRLARQRSVRQRRQALARRGPAGDQPAAAPASRTAVSAALSTTDERAFVTFDGVNTRLEPRLARASPRRAPPTCTSRSIRGHCGAVGGPRAPPARPRGVPRPGISAGTTCFARDPDLPALIDALDIVFPQRPRGHALRGGQTALLARPPGAHRDSSAAPMAAAANCT